MRGLPEHRGQQCRRDLRELLKWQTSLLHLSPSPTLQPLVRKLNYGSKSEFGTERPGRESAMREAVRLDVRPAPTSSTDLLAILTTKIHSETKMSDPFKVAKKLRQTSSKLPRVTMKPRYQTSSNKENRFASHPGNQDSSLWNQTNSKWQKNPWDILTTNTYSETKQLALFYTYKGKYTIHKQTQMNIFTITYTFVWLIWNAKGKSSSSVLYFSRVIHGNAGHFPILFAWS